MIIDAQRCFITDTFVTDPFYYMAAVVEIKYNPDIKQEYGCLLKNGKSKMAARGVAMRKLVQICFGVLKHQTPYQPRMV